MKIDPHRLSVGMYQHDIKASKLEKYLHDIVCECIGDVGVDINTASESLLRFVPGLNRKTAKAIVQYREKRNFSNRLELRNVPGIGPITYQHSVGFLLVKQSDWTLLDSTPVHPDDYEIANEIVRKHDEFKRFWNPKLSNSGRVYGDADEERILQLLRLNDPRESYQPVEIRTAKDWIASLETAEVKPGAQITGIVRNITSFGAFVQLIGANVKDDGLLHISQYPVGVSDPHYYDINQTIRVKVLSVESTNAANSKPQKLRISLSSRT